MNAQTKLQIFETQIDDTRTDLPDTNIAPKPSLASRLGMAMIVASVPLTLAWVALLGWMCVQLIGAWL